MTSCVVVSLRVGASPRRAFDVFVGQIGDWWQANPLFGFTKRGHGRLAFEPKLGGRLTETFADGKVFEVGRITVWEPGVRLELTGRCLLAASWRMVARTPRVVRGGALARRLP